MSLLVGVAAALPLGLMTMAFLIARRIGDFSIVDVTWSFNSTPLGGAVALLGSGFPQGRLVGSPTPFGRISRACAA